MGTKTQGLVAESAISGPPVRLLSVEPDALDLIRAWLGDPENNKWLDFGMGRQEVPGPMLKMMVASPNNFLRLYAPTSHSPPIGLVALSDISRFHTANIWYVLGDKDYAMRGLTTAAVALMLNMGFQHLNLTSIQAWTVASNTASVRILRENCFRPMGRLRQAHIVNGQLQDRLLFDLVATDRQS